MAKSLRSKWKKQMRAIKRVRYGLRELETLKMIVARDIHIKPELDMANLADVVTVTDAKTVCEAAAQPASDDESVEEMDVETKRKYNRRTMKDANGTYPPWMNQKKIRKLSLANKKAKKAKRAGGNKKAKIGGKRRHR